MNQKCFKCKTPDCYNQLCGFYFCHVHWHWAIERGASHWRRLYFAIYPWR